MKRSKSVESLQGRRRMIFHFLLGVATLYLLFIAFKFRRFSEVSAVFSGDGSVSGGATDVGRGFFGSARFGGSHHRKLEDGLHDGYGPVTGITMKSNLQGGVPHRRGNFPELERMAQEAWALGIKAWEEVEKYGSDVALTTAVEVKPESCPSSMSMAEAATGKVMLLPCGLVVGSSITFMLELQGLESVDGEDPPKILHLNPRLKGDWSQRPIVEHNTRYKMQWGKALRCDGVPSQETDETVDGFVKCEKWDHVDSLNPKETKLTSWLKQFVGRPKKPDITWPFPFAEGKLFVLTIQAGVEGYNIYVGGRHISSFPYRTGFILEDATGLAIKGDVDIHSIHATALPTSHFSVQQVLEMSEKWKSIPLPQNPIQLFIGILSATNHFAERMAVRKTWMQYPAFLSSRAIARFFVALVNSFSVRRFCHLSHEVFRIFKGARNWVKSSLNYTSLLGIVVLPVINASPRKDVNAALKKEAEYFKDIVILPFMDHYDLVVLKTIAICEFGVHNLTAAYIMKCDDDTFVRVDVILRIIEAISPNTSLYMGNINLFHRPLRSGKWAVTFEEWPEEIYPPYANGPGYVISSDIARFVVAQHANRSLGLFKMEDVSMGMWVEELNTTTTIRYSHSWRFCQYGCMENYYTAHYQSPRQMICLWEKLSLSRAECCNSR
ncbi:hypothetical protein GW17_00028689 [Ensete ventricosum]|nr:hypothetical protein GW17_00028689 [Ensete ventricosum]